MACCLACPIKQCPPVSVQYWQRATRTNMAALSPSLVILGEGDVKPITFGQSVKLDCSALCRTIDNGSESFSGELTLHAAGSGISEHFSLDTDDGVIDFTCDATCFYTETFVHIYGTCIGSYIDLDVGPYFKMTLQNADLRYLELLLQRIRFTVANNLFSINRRGPRIITLELREDSLLLAAAQTAFEVLA